MSFFISWTLFSTSSESEMSILLGTNSTLQFLLAKTQVCSHFVTNRSCFSSLYTDRSTRISTIIFCPLRNIGYSSSSICWPPKSNVKTVILWPRLRSPLSRMTVLLWCVIWGEYSFIVWRRLVLPLLTAPRNAKILSIVLFQTYEPSLESLGSIWSSFPPPGNYICNAYQWLVFLPQVTMTIQDRSHSVWWVDLSLFKMDYWLLIVLCFQIGLHLW